MYCYKSTVDPIWPLGLSGLINDYSIRVFARSVHLLEYLKEVLSNKRMGYNYLNFLAYLNPPWSQ